MNFRIATRRQRFVRGFRLPRPGCLVAGQYAYLGKTMERLDRGEQDAILPAESVKDERLIFDDLEGRREAVHRGLPVIGTLGPSCGSSSPQSSGRTAGICRFRSNQLSRSPGLIEVLLAMRKDGEPVSPARLV